jgi:hypothetical protein
MNSIESSVKSKWFLLACGRSCFLVLLLATLTSCRFSGLAIRHESKPWSGLVLDEYTGKPIAGAKVQVATSVWRDTSSFMDIACGNSESKHIGYREVFTDTNGIYTIPTWTYDVSLGWNYSEQRVITKPGEKPIDIRPQKFDPLPSGLPIAVIRHHKHDPTFEEILEQEHRLRDEVHEGGVSNALYFYGVHNAMVENGRFVEMPEHSRSVYIRPKPELVLTRIEWFSHGRPGDWGNNDLRSIAISLFPDDAKRLEMLMRTHVGQSVYGKQFVVMIDGKPVQSLWWPPTRPTGYLFFSKDRSTDAMDQFLKRLGRKIYRSKELPLSRR